VLNVAMTRARDELILTRTNSRGGRRVFWGGTRAHHGAAYFLQDLPEELTDAEAMLDTWDMDDEVIEPWR